MQERSLSAIHASRSFGRPETPPRKLRIGILSHETMVNRAFQNGPAVALLDNRFSLQVVTVEVAAGKWKLEGM
jgi:subtilisin-like proprotein convertase family protein